MTTYVLAQKEGGESDNSSSILSQDDAQSRLNILEQVEDARKLAVKWVDTVLVPLAESRSVAREIATVAALCILKVCCYASGAVTSADKAHAWGTKAVRSILAMLENSSVPSIVKQSWVRDVSYALAALSKSEQVTTKFLSGSIVAALPHALDIKERPLRLEILALLCATAVEHDLSVSGSGDTNSGTVKALLKSPTWTSVVKTKKREGEGDEDGDVAENGNSEEQHTTTNRIGTYFICSIGISVLEAAKKIGQCPDFQQQLQLTHSWAINAFLCATCLPTLPFMEVSFFQF